MSKNNEDTLPCHYCGGTRYPNGVAHHRRGVDLEVCYRCKDCGREAIVYDY